MSCEVIELFLDQTTSPVVLDLKASPDYYIFDEL